MVYVLMIFGWHQESAIVFTTPPWFTVVCCWGLAATLILSYPPIIQTYDHCLRMMFAPLQNHGSTYILRKMRTVPSALSVLPLLTYLMVFPVPSVIVVNSDVQRKSNENSNAYFAKLFHCQISLPSLMPTSTKTLLFLMEVILLVLW